MHAYIHTYMHTYIPAHYAHIILYLSNILEAFPYSPTHFHVVLFKPLAHHTQSWKRYKKSPTSVDLFIKFHSLTWSLKYSYEMKRKQLRLPNLFISFIFHRYLLLLFPDL